MLDDSITDCIRKTTKDFICINKMKILDIQLQTHITVNCIRMELKGQLWKYTEVDMEVKRRCIWFGTLLRRCIRIHIPKILYLLQKILCMPCHNTEELQLFISVFLILVRMWPGIVTRNFSKSAWEKGCTFINVFTLVTYAAALVKVCFYLILKILLLIEKLSHKLGKCSITGLTKIDFTPAIGHHWQVRVSSYSALQVIPTA